MTLVVLDLDESGNGEGQLAIGVQMELTEDGHLTIENGLAFLVAHWRSHERQIVALSSASAS